ncbi:MAG: sugar kinase [Verrucomicrobia bacterium]|nr:MAG: sugar kinase [Verrucomicrobiota bacterium]
MSAFFAGIEIGGTKLQLVIGDKRARILERKRLTVNPSKGAAGIRAQIETTLPELLRSRTIAALGVGFGGPVDWRTGRVARSHQIEGWSEFDLAGWLRGLISCRVVLDNDANVAALGEAIHGAGRGFNPVFYVTLGSGVGGGLVVDGKIYHGATPGEAEIGHVRLDRDGTTVESRCSGWAIDARIRKVRHASRLPLPSGKGAEAKWLAPALAKGDPVAKQILDELAADLAFGLSHVIHLFHPQIIVLGGGLSNIGEPLRGTVATALPSFVMDVFGPSLRVALASLAEDAVPIGALECAVGLVESVSGERHKKKR